MQILGEKKVIPIWYARVPNLFLILFLLQEDLLLTLNFVAQLLFSWQVSQVLSCIELFAVMQDGIVRAILHFCHTFIKKVGQNYYIFLTNRTKKTREGKTRGGEKGSKNNKKCPAFHNAGHPPKKLFLNSSRLCVGFFIVYHDIRQSIVSPLSTVAAPEPVMIWRDCIMPAEPKFIISVLGAI